MEEIMERYNEGFPTFERIFNLKSVEIIELLKEIFKDKTFINDILNDKPNVYKKIDNDIPTEIKICSWGTIKVSPMGVFHKLEHGNFENVLLFNKFFTLPE